MNWFARFAGWWATLSMLLATMGTCPCCGGPPCARGVALMGLLGALIPTFLRPKTSAARDVALPDAEATMQRSLHTLPIGISLRTKTGSRTALAPPDDHSAVGCKLQIEKVHE